MEELAEVHVEGSRDFARTFQKPPEPKKAPTFPMIHRGIGNTFEESETVACRHRDQVAGPHECRLRPTAVPHEETINCSHMSELICSRTGSRFPGLRTPTERPTTRGQVKIDRSCAPPDYRLLVRISDLQAG